MKKYLTAPIKHTRINMLKKSLGASRHALAVFFASKNASVSVYREVCGKRPNELVSNTGAPLCLEGVSSNITLGGSK
jgi:hypothetical protein